MARTLNSEVIGINILEIISYPFMQRALAAGVMMAALLAFIGTFVVIRKMAFFASGIAHASLSGVAIGIIASLNPMLTALFFSVIFSVVIYWMEKKYKMDNDTSIGIIFTSGMALGVLLISIQPGFQPELMSFLFGNILAIGNFDIFLVFTLGAVIFIFLLTNLRSITLLSLDSEAAYMSGVKVQKHQLLFYIALSVVVVLGIKVLGIVLVSALLIIPVAAVRLFATSFKMLIFYSIIFAEIIVLGGLFLSFLLDFPTGPTIVLLGTVLFSITALLIPMRA